MPKPGSGPRELSVEEAAQVAGGGWREAALAAGLAAASALPWGLRQQATQRIVRWYQNEA